MLAHLLLAFGIVAAAVGLTFFGIATSTYEWHDTLGNLGYALMAGGTVAAVIGYFMDRSASRRSS